MSTLTKTLIKHGIEPIFAKAFCKSLGPEDPHWVEGFNQDPEYWLSKLRDEKEVFKLIATFTSEDRFLRYMKREQKGVYQFYANLLKILYIKDYFPIIKICRDEFKAKISKSPKEWYWSTFRWDSHWGCDSDIGHDLLTFVGDLSQRYVRNQTPKSLHLIKDKEYKGKLLYPFLAPIVKKHGKNGNQYLADYLYFLGITGQELVSINTTFFHGRTGNDGLFNFKMNTTPNPHNKTALGRAMTSRMQKAGRIYFAFFKKWVEQDPAKTEQLIEFVEKHHLK